MTLRNFTIIFALLLVGTWASAQSYTFGLTDSNGDLYCDYLQISVSGGIAAGTDNMSACGYSTSPTLVGLASSNPQIAQYNVVTSGLDLADNALDWEAQAYTGGQWFLHIALKCSKQKGGKYVGKFGWIGLAGFSGFLAGINEGYLACTVPQIGDEDALQHGPSFGKQATRPQRK